MRFIYTLFVTTVFFCTFGKTAEPDKKLHKQCLYPTVKVTPNTRHSYGTGIIVRSVKIKEGEYHNVFITCAHVADSTEQYVVKVYEYKNWSQEIN